MSIGKTLSITSQLLGEERPIIVSLPTDYDSTQADYPVMYLTDGRQNIWHVMGTIEVLTSGNTKHEVAVGPSGTQIVFSEEVSTGQLSLFRANLPASGPIIDPPSSLNVGPVPLSDGLSPDWGL